MNVCKWTGAASCDQCIVIKSGGKCSFPTDTWISKEEFDEAWINLEEKDD